MKNFIFKSTAADLQKMFQLLETIQKNCLYTTYRIDSLLKKITSWETNKALQKQVDDYFVKDDIENIPEESQDHDSSN